MDRKPSAVRLPLHSDVSLLAQRRRELLRETHQKAPQARRVPLPPGTQRCHPPLPRRHQCKPKALYLDQGPQQDHHRRQARAPIVRFDPLASGQNISGRFQTMLTNGDMVWFTEERGAEERQWLIDVTQIAAVAEPWRDTAVPVSNDDPLVRQQGAAEVRNANT